MTANVEAKGRCPVNLIDVGGDDYYVHPKASRRLSLSPSAFLEVPRGSPATDLVGCTVVDWTQDHFTEDDLTDIATNFASHDDVWSSSFLAIVVLRAAQSVSINIAGKAAFVLTELPGTDLPNGPYVVQTSNGDIFAVSRLFEDRCGAFIGGSARPGPHDDCFKWLNIENRIAIPSRLYYEPTEARPLAGLRFAVKDTIDVAGLETGCGNRDYRALYRKRTSSARCIQQLIDAGALFIGKTKTTQFAEGQVPLQWFDYPAPFNPRGDFYQNPSSSSAGSAVASAAYSWLDFAIGTDTGGSIRHPAGVCGVYGLRPSTGAISTIGLYTVSAILDSVGLLARSASIIEAAFNCMLKQSYSSLAIIPPRPKYKLLYPIRAKGTSPEHSRHWFPFPGEPGVATEAESRFEDFIRKMEICIDCTRQSFNVDDLWRETRPQGQSDSLDVATGQIYTVLTTYNCVRETIDPFIADFRAANQGKSPFIDPVVKARQANGRQISSAQNAAAMETAKMFSKWVKETLLAQSDKSELPLLVFPQSWGRPEYRVDPDMGNLFFSTFSSYSLSYLSGCPDCTIPIGEIETHSRIREAKMSLPISLSILSPPGTDLALLALLKDLEGEGILKSPAAGALMYPAGK